MLPLPPLLFKFVQDTLNFLPKEAEKSRTQKQCVNNTVKCSEKEETPRHPNENVVRHLEPL